jgi:excisionase family DNA binding protein
MGHLLDGMILLEARGNRGSNQQYRCIATFTLISARPCCDDATICEIQNGTRTSGLDVFLLQRITMDREKTISSPYLTTEEAAAYLRTTVQGIYSLVKRGRLQPMPGRPGRLLFTRETLDKYLSGKFRRR